MVCPEREEIYLVNFDLTIGHEVKKKINVKYENLTPLLTKINGVNSFYPFDLIKVSIRAVNSGQAVV